MQRKFKFALCIFLAIVALLCTASAADIYVSADGDDTAAGTADAPVATLTQAYTLLGADGGTVLLADTVPVTATSGDCYIEPTHSAKITVTSAPDASGALDLTGIEHFHFGGETEWNSIGISANEVVLSADNNIVTMGQGLTVSSPSSDTEYRGGHRFCGAKLHLAAYAPCDTANRSITTAGGRLNVYSGEYRSISAWYGSGVTLAGGETQIILDALGSVNTIWIRYLCPGLFGILPNEALTAAKNSTPEVVLAVGGGVSAVETYRTTQNTLVGQLDVRWLLRDSVQGSATAVTAWDANFAENSYCYVMVYADEDCPAATRCASLLLQNKPSVGRYINISISKYSHSHVICTMSDGRLICALCGYEKCRHRTSEVVVVRPSTCSVEGGTRVQCTDLCGELITTTEVKLPLDPSNHAGNPIKTNYDAKNIRMAHRCSGCNALFGRRSGAPASTVYVGKCTGTPLDASNIAAYYAENQAQAGTSPQYPFANFEDAMLHAAKAATVYGKATICILDDAYVPGHYHTPATDGTITITGGTLHFDSGARYFFMYANIVFEHLTFKTNPTEYPERKLVIVAQNRNLVMGEGIVMGNKNSVSLVDGGPSCNDVKMYIVGGFISRGTDVNANVTIRSGEYWYVGGWNIGYSSADGQAKMTIGKTNPNDELKIIYLCPFSHGQGGIERTAETTMIFDGDAFIARLYVTTLNQASLDYDYVTNIVLQGNISGYVDYGFSEGFDIRGTADNDGFPKTIINLYTDARVATAVDDSYVFLGRKNPYLAPDSTLRRISAQVNAYSYEDYCQTKLGGHDQSGEGGSCSKCGYVAPQDPEPNPAQE